MTRSLESIPPEGDPVLAAWMAGFTKQCAVGLAKIDQPLLRKLDSAQPITHLVRPGLEPALEALQKLQANPTYDQAAQTGALILRCNGVRIFRREAWHDTCSALKKSTENGDAPETNLARQRELLRRTGRPEQNRVASRTLLVKGLEYDHVIIADLDKMRDPKNLYVALSRARKSVIVVGSSPVVTLKDGA